jgi:hypothetical protein
MRDVSTKSIDACWTNMMQRIFVLSPAKTTGKRASMLMNDRAEFELAQRLRGRAGAPLGEVFSFLSGLYFRGKLTYSQHFAHPPMNLAATYVITSDAGLMRVEELITIDRLKAFGEVPIDMLEPRYAMPFRRSIDVLQRQLTSECEVVLLGSIASNKYGEILVDRLGSQLVFPREFVGRGDMSRGV